MPGTGKTATTLEVVKTLKLEVESNRKLPKFDFIHINAMSLTNPNLVYTILNEKITGNRCNPTSSASFLDEFFKKGDKLKVLRARVKNIKSRER
jgi:Cdc6-like AAA superfamily ATPase